MIILKYLKKVVAKYKERMEPGSCGGTGTGGLVATATIINQKRRVSKIVEESYSTCLTRLHQHPDVVTQAHKFVTTQRGTGRRSRSSRLTPIAESSSSAASSHLSEHSSLCYSCERDYIGNKKFCKCCGKGLMSQRLRVIKSSRYDETRSFYAREFKHRSSQRPSSHRRVSSTHRRSVSKQQAKLTCNLFGEASSRTGGGVYKTTYLKKSKACSNIKQQRVEMRCKEAKRNEVRPSDNKLNRINETIGYEIKTGECRTGSSFLVDFASTPIKLAPKTSTPIKLEQRG